MTDSLARYTLIGEPCLAGKAMKMLRLAVFAPRVPSSMDFNVRVYFVEDTPDALEVCSMIPMLIEVISLSFHSLKKQTNVICL